MRRKHIERWQGQHGKICNDKFIVNLLDSSTSLLVVAIFVRQTVPFETRYDTNAIESNKYLITKGIKIQHIRRILRGSQIARGSWYIRDTLAATY